MSYNFSATGFPLIFSEMIAKSCMRLPSSEKVDSEFLGAMAQKAARCFWREYLSTISLEEQKKIEQAFAQKDTATIEEWFAEHANFEHDSYAQELAKSILDQLSKQLPEFMKQDFKEYLSTLLKPVL